MSYWERKRIIAEAKQANKKIGYNGDKVYVDGLLAYDPDAQSPEDRAEEDATKLWMYLEALKDLATEDRRYTSNYNLWWRWDDAMRLWWIGVIENDAAAGKDTIGVQVVARAIDIRLTRTRTRT